MKLEKIHCNPYASNFGEGVMIAYDSPQTQDEFENFIKQYYPDLEFNAEATDWSNEKITEVWNALGYPPVRRAYMMDNFPDQNHLSIGDYIKVLIDEYLSET